MVSFIGLSLSPVSMMFLLFGVFNESGLRWIALIIGISSIVALNVFYYRLLQKLSHLDKDSLEDEF